MELFTIEKNKAFLDFGGFYHSVHDGIIDNRIESLNTIELANSDANFNGTHFLRKQNYNQLELFDYDYKELDSIDINDYNTEDSYKEHFDLIDVDYRACQRNYSEALLELIDNYFKTNFFNAFAGIWSPEYYNYFTDQIELNVDKLDSKTKKFLENKEFNNKLKEFLEDYNNLTELEFDIDYKYIN